ncbi:MAG: glycosyltransferase family 39 protein [Nitrososphaerales archaeon]
MFKRKPGDKRKLFTSFNRHTGLIVFLSSFAVYLLTLNGVWATDHSTAFVEFLYSIFANHSFILGKVGLFQPHSVDVFAYNGNYYMANAPGTAFFALPFAVLAFLLIGHFSVFGDTLLLTELPIALANSIAAYFVYRISIFYFKKDVSAFLAFVYAFSTISWPFSSFFFQSDLSALFDLLAAYLAIRIGRNTGSSLRLILYCGLVVAVATTVDYVNAILMPILCIYIVASRRKLAVRRFNLVKSGIVFLGGASVAFLALGAYNYVSFGDPLFSSEQLYLKSPNFFGNFTFPMHLGVILLLFSPMRGLFLFSPILILGALGIWKMAMRSSVDREALLFLTLFLGILLPYSAWYDPTGGESFGPRFIISSIPFILIPSGFAISEIKGKYGYSVVYLLYAAGVLINGLASMVSILAPPTKQWMISPFVSIIIPHIASGQIDSWWQGNLGGYWFVLASGIILFALFIPMVCSYILEKYPEEPLNTRSEILHSEEKIP